MALLPIHWTAGGSSVSSPCDLRGTRFFDLSLENEVEVDGNPPTKEASQSAKIF